MGSAKQSIVSNLVNGVSECHICEASIEISPDIEVGELLMCPECGTEFEVTSLEPFTLVEAPMEEEDWGQ